MEVSERRVGGSEETLNECEICETKRSISRAAFGYCVECRIYLCKDCYQVHTAPPPCRDHKLLEGKHMPTKKLNPVDVCNTHSEEKILYFCKEHSALACQKCAFLLHRMCQEVCEISELSSDAENDQHYREMSQKSTSIESEMENNRLTRLKNLSKIDSNKKEAKTDIKDFCKAMHEHLYKIEKRMDEEVDQIGEKDLKSMDKVEQEWDSVGTDLNIVTTDLKTNRDPNRRNQLFITLIKAAVTMDTLNKKLITLSNANTVQEYRFIPDDRLKTIMTDIEKLGRLSVYSMSTKVSSQLSKVKVTPTRNLATATVETEDGINVCTKIDTNQCRITGSTMMEGDTTLAIVDQYNRSVKLVDVKQKSVVSQIAVSGYPWDVTQVQPDQLAVTLRDANKVQFLTVTGTSLSLGRQLDMSGCCCGIVHSNGKLFVSFSNPGKVQILSMSGSVLNTISTGRDGQPLFKYPMYVTLSAYQLLLYISDRDNNTVYCLDMDGAVKAIFKDQRLKNPYGVSTAEDGSVIVCGRESNNMYVISADCTQGRVLVDKTCGLVEPVCVTYSSGLSTLYVGQDDSDTLKVFKLK